MALFQTLKGFKDRLPAESACWEFILASAKATFDAYGFSMIETPIMESAELFKRSVGAATDIVEKEMYTFDDYGKSVSLRPEGTASAVRAYLEHPELSASTPAKLYYIGPMFRRERPQAGRFRQFHQIGAEIIGEASPNMDIEILSLLFDFFQQMNLPNLSLEINSLGCPICRPVYREALQLFLKEKVTTFCEDCVRRFESNPLRILDCKKPGCKEATKNAPEPVTALCLECSDHFKAVREGLTLLGIPHVINSRLVRGLDYYTKTAFEMTTTNLGSQNAIAAGGRYDGLVELLGGSKTSAIGFAIGIERVVALINSNALQGKAKIGPTLFMAPLGTAANRLLLPMLFSLRQKKIKTEMGNPIRSLKNQIKQADKLSAKYLLIVGDTELQTGKGILRNMSTHAQEEVSLANPIETLITRIAS
ncbi:MAG: histidine--tRNA ligase [Nitrospirota bacterium]